MSTSETVVVTAQSNVDDRCIYFIVDFDLLKPSSIGDPKTAPNPLGADSKMDAQQFPKLFMSKNEDFPKEGCRCFMTHDIRYDAFCDDFGPMSMLSIMQFVSIMDGELFSCQEAGIAHLVYLAGEGRREFTNAAFLIGAYLILKFDQEPQDVERCFQLLNPIEFEGFRDATFSVPDFRLRLIDCWEGLHRGKMMGWLALPTANCSSQWGQIDRDAYATYQDPLNADLNEVVPKKFVAFRGPKHLAGPNYRDNYDKGTRDFDPKHYLDAFEDLEVSTVVRLNEAAYSSQTFKASGIYHYDLFFDDCTPPPPAVVKRFIEIADSAKGVVAVHCKAGLGRTGTLIALYMMRTYGFSARQAIGWLRIMRPGSVIGYQQHFLCKVDAEMMCRAAAASGRFPRNAVSAEAWALRTSAAPAQLECSWTASPNAAELAEQVSSGMDRHDQARGKWARPG